MKPLYLEIEGVNSFVENQQIDFKELSRNNLFCISGVTGSGKTTVLDCVLLGLYARLPAFSSRGRIEDYINLRAEKAVIKFTFELDGTVYRTERIISRKAGANSVKLIDCATGVAVKEKSDDAFAFLQEKLGLSVDEFARVIVLQQGQFAQFLKSGKADRNKMVINLFRLTRFEDVPRRFSDAEKRLRGDVDRLTEDLEEYKDLTAESVKDAERTAKIAVKNVAVLLKAREQSRKRLAHVKQLADKQKLYDDAFKRKQELVLKKSECDALSDEVAKEKQDVEQSATRLTALKAEKEQNIALLAVMENDVVRLAEIAKKESELVEMRSDYDVAKKAFLAKKSECDALCEKIELLSKQISSYGYNYSLDDSATLKGELSVALKNLDDDLKELDRSQKTLDGYHRDYHALATKKEALTDLVKKAEEEERIAQEKLDEARLTYSAEHIKISLHEGDVCPVCGNKVGKTDCHGGAVDFAPLKRRLDDAKAVATGRKSELETLMLEYSGVSAKIAEEEKNLKRFIEKTQNVNRNEVAGQVEKLSAYSSALGYLEENKKRLAVIEAEKIKAEGRAEEIANRGKQAREQLDEIKKSLKETDPKRLAQKIIEIKQAVSGVAEFEKRYDEQTKRLTEKQNRLVATVASVEAEQKSLEEILKNKPDASEVSMDVAEKENLTAENAYEQALSQSARAEKDRDAVVFAYEKKRAISQKRQAIKERYEKIHDVSSAMSRGEFIAYVATEYIKDFTFNASNTLSELTGGKYALEYDEAEGEFYVTDFLNNNEKRKAKTLSGGETFLASLAMAIALSQEIARYGNFDFFFIDEGFGTLHEQALDQALEVLRRLSETSLVGLVTHRTELKEKIPVTLLVTPADDDGGSRCKIV